MLAVFRGQKATSPLDVSSGATLAANSVTAATATVTTTEDEELIVAMVAGAAAGGSVNFRAVTDPTVGSGVTDQDPGIEGVWTELHDSVTLTGGDTAIAVGYATKATAGATGELRATQAASSRHVMIAAAFKTTLSDRSSVDVSKLAHYDVMLAGSDTAETITKLSRYDVLMAAGTVSVTKFSRYDILVPPTSSFKKRRSQNVILF
ncbi:hypothetical protein X727_23115 [Mesorhizobium sp. L103C119B0]|nr:hypothetical protein X727_23115 [Mesorhizobium sp. L103C119B0]